MRSRSGGRRASKAAWLESLGFDNSKGSRVGCTQCEALVINGVPCHETGCPNQNFECRGCSNRVSRRGAFCVDCQ